jgi:hypothetical protein
MLVKSSPNPVCPEQQLRLEKYPDLLAESIDQRLQRTPVLPLAETHILTRMRTGWTAWNRMYCKLEKEKVLSIVLK